MSHTRNSDTKNLQESGFIEKVAGTIPATIVQVGTLHPLDTLLKRMIKNTEKIVSIDQLNKVIFLNKSNELFLKRYLTLYAGVGSGFLYKILQFTYKFSCQPEVVKLIKKSDMEKIVSQFITPNLVNPVIQALSGSIIGLFEAIFLLPIDKVKILKQNNPGLKNYSTLSILGQEYKENGLKGAYKGLGITIARNIPGSGALFLFPPLVFNYILQKDKSQASWIENAAAYGSGGAASLLASHIQDMLKIRLQSFLINQKTLLAKQSILFERQKALLETYAVLLRTQESFLDKSLLLKYKEVLSRNHEKILRNHKAFLQSQKSARDVAREIVQKEGYRGLSRGLPVKLLTQVPKLTLVPYLSDNFTAHVQSLGLFARGSYSNHKKNELPSEHKSLTYGKSRE